MSAHNHGPTASLLDPVYCLTCQSAHIATIPAVTFACSDCGFGAWGHSVAAAHAINLPEHVVYPLHHRTVCHSDDVSEGEVVAKLRYLDGDDLTRHMYARALLGAFHVSSREDR